MFFGIYIDLRDSVLPGSCGVKADQEISSIKKGTRRDVEGEEKEKRREER